MSGVAVDAGDLPRLVRASLPEQPVAPLMTKQAGAVLFVDGVFGILGDGVWRCSKRSGGMWNIPQIQLTGPASLRFFGLIALLTVLNVAIVSAGTYTSVKYMD